MRKDPCGYKLGDDLYISPEEFAADANLRAYVRRTLAEINSKMKVAVMGVLLGSFIAGGGALFWRHIEYKYFIGNNSGQNSVVCGKIYKELSYMNEKVNVIGLQAERNLNQTMKIWARNELSRIERAKEDK